MSRSVMITVYGLSYLINTNDNMTVRCRVRRRVHIKKDKTNIYVCAIKHIPHAEITDKDICNYRDMEIVFCPERRNDLNG